MLALLDEVPGVAASRVDWTGTRFLIELAPDASTDAVVARADEVLGGETERLDREDEARDVQGYRTGKKWLRSAETFAMSLAEARILALRYGEEAAESAGLDGDRRARLVKILEAEITAAFSRILESKEGLNVRLRPEFERAFESTLEKCRSFLSEAELARVEEYLRSVAG